MAMTKEEWLAKKQIMDILSKQGYPTYASLFDYFDLNLTNDPSVVAYMIPNKAKIVINRNLDIEQVSTIVRHEILHEYLTHQLRMEQHVGKDKWDKRSSIMHKISNIAGDYEISNRGYTDKDKDIARSIKLGDKEPLKGLVTEDDHPDWVDKSIEEMYDLLMKEYEQDKEKFEQMLQQMGDMNSQGDPQIQQAEEIERQAKAISDDAGNMIGDSQDSDDSNDDTKSGGSGQKSDDKSNDDNTSDGSGQKSDEDGDQNSQKRSKSSQKGGGKQNAPGGKNDSEAQDIKDDADKISKAAKELKDKIKELQDSGNSNDVFKSKEQINKEKAIQRRIEKIEKALGDLQTRNSLIDEVDVIKDAGNAVKASKELSRYKANPSYKFQVSLEKFIKNSTTPGRINSWARPSRRHGGTGIVAQGKALNYRPVPVINVYFDQSASFNDRDIEQGNTLIGILNNYVKQGKIKIKLYYFACTVKSTAAEARAECGTYGEPVLKHIQQTKPDNVIILTDSDIDDCTSSVVVPGAVWFLFRDGKRSQDLIDHLKGQMLTEIFDITYGTNYDD